MMRFVELKKQDFPNYNDSIAVVYAETYKHIPQFYRDLTHQEYIDLLILSRKHVSNPRALPSIDDKIEYLEQAIDKEYGFKDKQRKIDRRIQEFADIIQEQNKIVFSKKQLQKLGLRGR